MTVQHRIEFLTELRWEQYPRLAVRCALEFFRGIQTELSIARQNKQVMEKLRRMGAPIKLELGSGSKRGANGWTTVDLDQGSDIQLNLGAPLPFYDNEVAEIYSSHVLEHFYYQGLLQLLAESRRILQPEGRFRVAVPNARIWIDAYLRTEPFNEALYCGYKPALHNNTRIDYLNYIAYMDGNHRHLFDAENLLAVLKVAGFRDVKLRNFDPTVDVKERDFESIYAVAVK